MRKVYILAIFSLLISIASEAQKKVIGSIKGKVVDTLSKQNLADASISVLDKDSAIISFGIANQKGEFVIKDIEEGSYRLLVTYQSYGGLLKKFTITPENKDLDVGTIHLDKSGTLLQEVVVGGAPIRVKNDTVEFSANAFRTKPNSTAEDLFKKLPGVQVDKDGNVKAQGEDVQKVLVDGKEFFGNDAKLATKNITADMIESVQVFDDMSDQAKFSRIDDGSRSKTVNIKLKKDKRKGYFGRGMLGVGTEGRYETSISFNKFNGDQRISIIGGSNNVNKQNFNFSDIVTNMGGFGARNAGGGGGGMQGVQFRPGGGGGGFGGFGGGGAGITRTLSAGINYSDKWGQKVDVTGSYFYSESENRTQRNSIRQTFFPDDSLSLQNQESSSRNFNQNHRFNLRFEYYIDSMNSLLYTPSFTLQHSESNSLDTTFTRSIKASQDYLAITGVTANTNERDGFNLNNNLLYRRKFHKLGRTLTIGLNNSLNNSEGNGTNYAPLVFYQPDGTFSGTRNQDIRSSQETRSNNNVVSASYTEPIGNNKILEFNYAYTNSQTTSDRRAYDYDNSSGKYDKVNLPQTNYFENGFVAHRAGTNFRIQNPKYNFQVGGAVQFSELTSFSVRAMTGKDTTINQKYTNLFPTANFQYSFSRTKNLRFNYRGRTNQPSISQLQDVPDITNPLQIRTGNPALIAEFNNNFNLSYNSFNPTTFKFLNVNLNFGNVKDKIVNSIDTQGRVQLIRPVNLDGAFNARSFVTFGIPLKGKMKGSNINFNNSVMYNRDVSLVYKQKNITNNLTIQQTAGVNLDFKQKLNIGINATVGYNSAKYSVQKTLNTEYYTQRYSVDFSYTMLKSLVLSTDFDYEIISGRAEGFNQSIPLLHASLAKQLFKKKNGELKLSVNDIFNQNQNIIRNVGDNYLEDINTVVLKRYFMLTFTYNLNRAGAGAMQPNQRGGGMPGMQRQRMERN